MSIESKNPPFEHKSILIRPEDIGTKIKLLEGYGEERNRSCSGTKRIGLETLRKLAQISMLEFLWVEKEQGYRVLDGQHRSVEIEYWGEPILWLDVKVWSETGLAATGLSPSQYVKWLNSGKTWIFADTLSTLLPRSPWPSALDAQGLYTLEGTHPREAEFSHENILRAYHWVGICIQSGRLLGQYTRNKTRCKAQEEIWTSPIDAAGEEAICALSWWKGIISSPYAQKYSSTLYASVVLTTAILFYMFNKGNPAFPEMTNLFRAELDWHSLRCLSREKATLGDRVRLFLTLANKGRTLYKFQILGWDGTGVPPVFLEEAK